MQIDIHHTGVYVLCRLAGMQSTYARIVAYSSQQVDDATHGRVLVFTNGDVFRQTMTAHKALSKKNTDVSDALEVWMPFHFLPSADETNGKDPFVTTPDSKALDLLLEDLHKESDLALYRLGIGLHCFADTFSHQDFKGFYDSYNNVELSVDWDETNLKDKLSLLFFQLLDIFRSDAFAIGHGQVLANPDIPFVNWSYIRDGEAIKVNNLEERFLPGLQKMYEYLVSYVSRHSKYSSGVCARPFTEYKEIFKKLLSFQCDSEERHRNWLGHIHLDGFSFEDFDETDKSLSYDPREWFNEAVEKEKVDLRNRWHYRLYNYYKFSKKQGFNDSHWVKYMQAANQHKQAIIYEILPRSGVNIG
ncbi:MAG: hypothetical protein APF84_00220 [Gracilibacter sp. BRH_c7a]|nr:MAG: hypothetical protein APF84_00220 [Gracilibacter sp. BRH_c7a]